MNELFLRDADNNEIAKVGGTTAWRQLGLVHAWEYEIDLIIRATVFEPFELGQALFFFVSIPYNQPPQNKPGVTHETILAEYIYQSQLKVSFFDTEPV